MAIMAVASNGQSIISEIPVIIGEAPVTISVERSNDFYYFDEWCRNVLFGSAGN